MSRFQQAKKRHRFGAKKTTVDGISFQSKGEAERFVELRNEAAMGLIEDFRTQHLFQFWRDYMCVDTWRIDFTYWRNGEPFAEDYGIVTQLKKRHIKNFLEEYGDVWRLLTTNYSGGKSRRLKVIEHSRLRDKNPTLF